MLQKKKILIGITGSIAAYKIILLVRLLIKNGAEVKVIMTLAAKEFVSPLVLATLSKNKVLTEIANEDTWANHVELGRWADIMLIAPLSCNSLAKMANGVCDNLLTAVYLSATCPIIVAPAMDEDMWLHPSTKRNLNLIKSYGNKIIAVDNGELASGLFGEGRMAEPEFILNTVVNELRKNKILAGKKVLITAGPTFEAIDPVRYISNHSSGKMGYEIAKEFSKIGAEVCLISGPTNLELSNNEINLINVFSSDEMFKEVENKYKHFDIIIMAAAVADYKPLKIAINKIKKEDALVELQLEKTKDILKFVGLNKLPNQFIVGFALETENEIENAKKKLKNKKADCIILNSYNKENNVFGSDLNKITIIDNNETEINFEPKLKSEVAQDIVSYITSKISNEKK